MSNIAVPGAAPWDVWRKLFHGAQSEVDVAARPKDGLIVFAVMWGIAMMLSASSHITLLNGDQGMQLALITWAALCSAALLVMFPRKTGLLMLVAGLMSAQYLLRLPASSNNQTIALFMNGAVLSVIGLQMLRERTTQIDREMPYEQLRGVARALLAVMYFYGIFHKINTDFLNPDVSCATALYRPLAGPFGLGDNIFGQYLAIISTFVVETIAIVCLYWRRFFWVGLLVSLPFHFIIPLSGYSWYMDFSSLVFALYMLAVPREVASGLYSTGTSLLRSVPRLRPGISGLLVLGLAWIAALGVAWVIGLQYPDRSLALLWHSAWLLVWGLFGGVSMIFIIRAALLQQPYRVPPNQGHHSRWVYIFPAVLFLSCTSPYLGLKTESSIAMFSNLHTEGGVSNHLLFPQPPYLFDYQSRVTRVIASSDPVLNGRAANPDFGLVEHDIALRLLRNPEMWITYEMDGERFERTSAATYTGHRPSRIEQKLLDFKPVDWKRPKACSH